MNRVRTVDVHVAGEPLRVITGGFPEPGGHTILEKRDYCLHHLDDWRRALMLEPRGHPDMYGALPVPPSHPDAAVGVVFLHNEGYSTMCGHGIIGLVTVLLEEGLLSHPDHSAPLLIETPSGLVLGMPKYEQHRVRSVAFRNVPSFVRDLDQSLEVPEIGTVRYDLAFGGAYYAFCQAEDLGLRLDPEEAGTLADVGMAIKRTIASTRPISHSGEPQLGYLYGVIFVGPPNHRSSYCRHVCIFADGAVDRSPTGTGVSAHLAILAARKAIPDNSPFLMEGILGTTFTGKIVERVEYYDVPAIIPEVEGQAYFTGNHEFILDPADPFRSGFRLK